MPLGTKYKPGSVNQYSSTDLNAWHQGYKFSCAKTSTTNCDYLITDDCLIDGGQIIAINCVFGDTITCQIIDKDNVMGYGTNTVLNTFVSNWYLNPEANGQWNMEVRYPAKLFGGLYVRVIYNSIGTTNDVDLAINYKLHKVLW